MRMARRLFEKEVEDHLGPGRMFEEEFAHCIEFKPAEFRAKTRHWDDNLDSSNTQGNPSKDRGYMPAES